MLEGDLTDISLPARVPVLTTDVRDRADLDRVLVAFLRSLPAESASGSASGVGGST